MRFGIWSPTNPREGVSMVDLYRQQIEEVVVAEQCGFDHYWFYEHHVSPSGPMPSPNLLIAAAGERTSRIRLGTMVNILPYRHPLIAAEEAAMLDVLTNGRLDWGVGRGLKPLEFDAFCLRQADSRAAFDEHMDILLRAWADENFEFRGKHFQVNKQTPLSPLPVQKPYPTLYCSAQSEESLRWAAERDIHFVQIDSLVDEARRDQQFYRALQTAKGFAPQRRLVITREVYVAPTMEQARAEAQPWLERYWQLWHRYAQLTSAGRMPEEYMKWRERAPMLASMSFEDLNRLGLIMIGTPEHVASRLIEHTRELDLAAVACVFKFGGMPYDMVLKSMRMFGDEVIPRVRAAMPADARVAA
jgi:alkanesulfonate monooxygenase SsuD/methylene tetrahydromethanopterin reductase-like flavin-dependent oxidoreductase (luciferase family)